MKSAKVLEGSFDWERAKVAFDNVVDDGGNINWGAAFAADPGVCKCPKCNEYYWREGTKLECTKCGEQFSP